MNLNKKLKKYINNLIYDNLGIDSAIDKDGINYTIFDFLWMQNKELDLNHIVNIPNTIIIKYRKILCWYFVKNKLMKKKTKSKLSPEYFINYFYSKYNDKDKVIFMYIYIKNNNKHNLNNLFYTEYLSINELEKYIEKDTLRYNGMIQEIIPPYSFNNNIFRVNYFNNITQFFEIRNTNKFDNKNNTYKVFPTFEDNNIFKKELTIKSSVVKNVLQSITFNIIKHIETIIQNINKIYSINLYYKIHNNKVYLLFCDSLRSNLTQKYLISKNIESYNSLNNKPKFLINEKCLDILPDIKKADKFDLNFDYKCNNCLKLFPKNNLYEINYEKVYESSIKNFKRNLNNNNSQYFINNKINKYNISLKNKQGQKQNNSYFNILPDISNTVSNYNNNQNKLFLLSDIVLNTEKIKNKLKNYLKKYNFINKSFIVCDECYTNTISLYHNMDGNGIIEANKLKMSEHRSPFISKSINGKSVKNSNKISFKLNNTFNFKIKI